MYEPCSQASPLLLTHTGTPEQHQERRIQSQKTVGLEPSLGEGEAECAGEKLVVTTWGY